MNFRHSLLLPLIFVSGSIFSGLQAQQDNLRSALANLTEDVRLLAQRVGVLQIEVEELRRENAQLRRQVTAAQSNDQSQQTRADILRTLESRMETLRREFRQADEAQKKEIIAEVTRQVDSLGRETQRAIQGMADAINQTPNISTPHRFSDDYPSTGVEYTVRRGDSLSKIAREHGATVRDIQNANRIADPRALQAGQVIIIPIRE